MVDFKTMYEIMLTATKDAVKAIDGQNYGEARSILVNAQESADNFCAGRKN